MVGLQVSDEKREARRVLWPASLGPFLCGNPQRSPDSRQHVCSAVHSFRLSSDAPTVGQPSRTAHVESRENYSLAVLDSYASADCVCPSADIPIRYYTSGR